MQIKHNNGVLYNSMETDNPLVKSIIKLIHKCAYNK